MIGYWFRRLADKLDEKADAGSVTPITAEMFRALASVLRDVGAEA